MATKEWKEREDELLSKVIESGRRPTMLLHACCAPCASAVLELLASHFQISLYYYNPNIAPQSEYFRRHDELKRFIKEFPLAKDNNVELIDCEDFFSYNDLAQEWLAAIDIKHHPQFEKERERGARCISCYRARMEKVWDYAVTNGFEWFATTLTLSPHKDATSINNIGISLEDKLLKSEDNENKTRYFISDFKKANGYLRSTQLSKKYNLYRQEYCGCVYSRGGGGKSFK